MPSQSDTGFAPVSSVVFDYGTFEPILINLVESPPESYIDDKGLCVPTDFFKDKLGVRPQKMANFVAAYRDRILDIIGSFGYVDLKYRKKDYIPASFSQGGKVRNAVRISSAILFIKKGGHH